MRNKQEIPKYSCTKSDPKRNEQQIELIKTIPQARHNIKIWAVKIMQMQQMLDGFMKELVQDDVIHINSHLKVGKISKYNS